MADLFELFRKIAKKDPVPPVPVTHLIVGLGNPGKKYENTRHNAGFLALDRIAERAGASVNRARFHALVGEATIGGHHVLLMKPQTLMNASGLAVQEAAEFYKLTPGQIIVLSDDTSLPVGALRVRKKGSSGGQKGLNDIITCLGTEEFPRVRIGVGAKPHPDYDLAAWVLSQFSDRELETIRKAREVAGRGVGMILDGDFDGAMQLCNSYRPEEETNP